MFADDDEDRQEIGHPEKLPDLSAEIDQYKFAACRAGGDVEANQCAEAHAVHVGKVGQVERDSFVIREQLPDLGIENVLDTRYQPAFASHNGFAVGTFNLKRESTLGCFDGHKDLALSRRVGGRKTVSVIVSVIVAYCTGAGNGEPERTGIRRKRPFKLLSSER